MKIGRSIVASLRKAKADYIRRQYARYYKRAKYTTKREAIAKLANKRFSKREADNLKKRVNAHLKRNVRIKGVIADKVIQNKIEIKFELSHESTNYLYYRTPYVLQGVKGFWEVYGEAIQDFVEKNSASRFVGFKYAAHKFIGEMVSTSDGLFEFSPHFKYEDFFGFEYSVEGAFNPKDVSNVGIWVENVFGISLLRKLDRYREESITLSHFYIVAAK